MIECNVASMQAERGITERKCLRFAGSSVGKISLIAVHWPAEMPKMDTNLKRIELFPLHSTNDETVWVPIDCVGVLH